MVGIGDRYVYNAAVGLKKMKNTIILMAVTTLLTGCVSGTRYASDEEKEATWNCILRGSWTIVRNPESHSYSSGQLLIITNEMKVPLLFNVGPWWGTDPGGRYAAGETAIYAPTPPASFVAPGDTVGVYIEEPFFFKNGAVFTFWRQTSKKDPDVPDAAYFDVHEFRRLTGKEMPSQLGGRKLVPVRERDVGQQPSSGGDGKPAPQK
jgi:hypothetical protein